MWIPLETSTLRARSSRRVPSRRAKVRFIPHTAARSDVLIAKITPSAEIAGVTYSGLTGDNYAQAIG